MKFLFNMKEIALDILCRMAMYYSIIPQTKEGVMFIEKLISAMPIAVRISLKDPKVGPRGILINMRTNLNDINKTNENVNSFPITCFGIEVARSVPYKRKICGSTWLDFSKEVLSLYIPEKDVMMKVSYHAITRVHFATATNTMQVKYSIECHLLSDH